jgi:hypothetical protein
VDASHWLPLASFAAAALGSAVLLTESAPGSSPVDDIKVCRCIVLRYVRYRQQFAWLVQYTSYSEITEYLLPSFWAIRRKYGIATPSPVRLNVMNRPQVGSSIDVGFKVSVTWKTQSTHLRTLADMYCSQTGCTVTSESDKTLHAKSSTRECSAGLLSLTGFPV